MAFTRAEAKGRSSDNNIHNTIPTKNIRSSNTTTKIDPTKNTDDIKSKSTINIKHVGNTKNILSNTKAENNDNTRTTFFTPHRELRQAILIQTFEVSAALYTMYTNANMDASDVHSIQHVEIMNWADKLNHVNSRIADDVIYVQYKWIELNDKCWDHFETIELRDSMMRRGLSMKYWKLGQNGMNGG